jgi:hypothetical protein
MKARDRLGVGGGGVLDPSLLAQEGVLGADGRVVEAGGDRVRVGDLPLVVLEEERAGAVEDAEPAAGEACRVLAGPDTASTRLDPQAKALGEHLRARLVDVPESLLA